MSDQLDSREGVVTYTRKLDPIAQARADAHEANVARAQAVLDGQAAREASAHAKAAALEARLIERRAGQGRTVVSDSITEEVPRPVATPLPTFPGAHAFLTRGERLAAYTDPRYKSTRDDSFRLFVEACEALTDHSTFSS